MDHLIIKWSLVIVRSSGLEYSHVTFWQLVLNLLPFSRSQLEIFRYVCMNWIIYPLSKLLQDFLLSPILYSHPSILCQIYLPDALTLFLNLKLATVYHVSLPPPNNNKIRFPGSFCTRTWIFLCWWFFLPCFFLLFCLSFLPFLLSFHFLSFFFSCVLCLVLWFVNKTLSLYFLSISLTLLLLDSWLEFSFLSPCILCVNDL